MQCDLGDFSLYYEAYGAGRPFMMLPGRPSDHRSVARLTEPLFKQRNGWLRLYPDLPGTGRTPPVDHLATHDQMLDTMLAFIDKVIPDQRFTLAGLSYGGYLARGVVHHRAPALNGVMLCAPRVRADFAQAQLPPRTPVVEDPAVAAPLGPGASLLVAQTPKVAEAAREIFAEVQLADNEFNDRLEAAGPASFEVDPHPPVVEVPTLIITGRQDHLCGYKDAWDLLVAYPRATYAVLDRAGHLVNIEQDALCWALMGEWLDRVEESSAI